MDIQVQTGQTKSKRGMTLLSKSFTSSAKEDVLLLLQAEATPAEAKKLEEECSSVIKHALLETDGDAATRLDGTLKELNGLLKGLTFSQTVGEVHAIVGIVDMSGVLHISHAGRAEAYVVRGGAASQITEYSRGKPTPAFVHIASGPLEPRDTIVISSQRLLRTVTPAQLAQLAQRGEHLMDELIMELESEKEHAAVAILHVSGKSASNTSSSRPTKEKASRRRTSGGRRTASLSGVLSKASGMTSRVSDYIPSNVGGKLKTAASGLLKDLHDPKRKRKAHLLLLAGTLAVFLIIWAGVNISGSSQRSQTRAELQTRLEEVSQLVRTAENRRLSGEMESANAILEQAEQRAKQVIDNEANLFRAEALDLLEQIRVKREEINNIVRISTYTHKPINLSVENPAIEAQGFINRSDGEFLVYDRQSLYRVLPETVEEPELLTGEELILDADDFPRFQTVIFQTTDNSVIELINGQPTSMKTEDPAGWIKGSDIETYLRFLYILSPENNQIYKYERLSNRYSAPSEYNVNGDLEGGLDMAIDGNIYILKEGGEMLKLLRGETQPFTIRHLPEGALANATKLYKVEEGNFYFLDPENARVIVATDGGGTGESSYVKQYILQGDQIGELQDLYIDDEEIRLYVIDEKRIHVVDLR